jgi:ferredoxin
VKVRVDPDKCQGHNRCYSLAPELFDVDDYGYATAAGDGAVAVELQAKAKLAAANCPEFAVIIEDED